MGVNPNLMLSAHVCARETTCRCGACGLWRVSTQVLELYEALRAAVNRARRRAGGLRISSGARCPAYQRKLNPGSRRRMHVPGPDGVGHALDVAAPRDLPLGKFFELAVEVAATCPPAGLGLYPRRGFVHLDDGAGAPPGRRWTL